MDEEKSALDLEWERRTLCSDGSCIGVIGPDGKCNECGKPYEGDLPKTDLSGEAASNAAEDPAPEGAAEEEASGDAEAGEAGTADNPDEEWASRRLCSDGSCIGVIGPDGKCKECGKPYEG